MTQTPEPDDAADALPAAHARGVLALVIAGTLLVVLDITIVTVGLPRIQAELGGSLASIQWVIIAYTITMGAVTQTVGTLSDRLGRRAVYLTGIVVFTTASLACGLAPTTGVLDAARGVQGIGGAILMANGLPLISQTYQGQRRNMAIATWSTVATAAGVVAPLAGGLLIDALNWRAMFLLNVPVGVFAFALALAWLPSGGARTGRSGAGIDWGGTVLLVTALGLANFALLRGAEVGWGSGQTLAQFAVAAVLLAGFLAVQRRVPAPTLELSLFRAPTLTGAVLAVFMSRVLTIGGTVYLVQYLQGGLHLTPTQSGLVLVPAFVAQMAAGMLGGKLQAWFAPGHVIATGYAAKAVAGAWLALASTPAATPWLLAVPLLVWGFGGGLAGAPVMSVAMRAAGQQQAGMVAGTVTSLASIGAGVGTAVLGVLYTARLGGVVAGDPAVPDTARDAVAAAATQGDLQQALALTPPAARAGVRDLLEQAVASGTSAVLWCSAVLALATVAVVLALIGRRYAPTLEQATGAPNS